MSEGLQCFLVRHGLTDWNEQGRLLGRSEVGLNARGRRQAELLAQALRAFPVEAVLASPQRRAQETAAVIAEAHGLAVETSEALAEVWLGRWVGKTFAEIAADPEIDRYLRDPTYGGGVIEPVADVQRRMVGVVERLRAGRAGGTVVLVSHGDPLRALIAHYLGLDLSAFRRFALAPGSVSVLRFGAQRARLLLLNWRPGGLEAILR